MASRQALIASLDKFTASVQKIPQFSAAAGMPQFSQSFGFNLSNTFPGNIKGLSNFFQGMTASVPVIRYAKHLGVSEEKLYRALVVSDLVTIHQKTGIGRLSAYCGAVSAGVGAGAGIAYLYGGKEDEIAHTIVNALAIDSGLICDGAKSSCAAKIAPFIACSTISGAINSP